VIRVPLVAARRLALTTQRLAGPLRRAGRLVAHAVHREPDAPRGKGIARAVRRELERLAAWQGAGDVELRSVPAEWPLR
jgi:uncharacterized protein YcaQ